MSHRDLFAVAVLSLSFVSCSSSIHSPEEKYYLVSTNITVPYWQEARAGLSRAGAQLGVKVDMVGPDTYDPKAERDQFRETMNQSKKPTGMIVSATDANLLKPEIDAAVGQGIPVITIDSDAPASKRLTFIGTDNYKAGVTGAKVVAEKLQGKGNVVVFTMPEQANLKDRLRGYTDTFAEHPGIKVTEVVDLKGDPRVAFDKTMEILDKNAKVDAFVSLVSIAGPEIAAVIDRKSATGKVVVAMDTDARVLEAIQKGSISATIGQKPFTMAFLAVKALDDLHHHPLKSLTDNFAQDSFSPLPAFVDTGATLIDKGNAGAFIEARKSETSPK
jgi:ribose transport system substrate-binding protein